MKDFLKDALLYMAYGMVMGMVGFFLGVEIRDCAILGFTSLALISLGSAITKRVPRV